MILLDTNVVSELMKSAPEPAVMAWINPIPGATLFVSAVTHAEILYGIALVPEEKRREGLVLAVRTAFETYFRGRILPFDSEAAEAFAALAAGRRQSGRPISPARAHRSASPVHSPGRNSRKPTATGTSPCASVSDTKAWQLARLPS